MGRPLLFALLLAAAPAAAEDGGTGAASLLDGGLGAAVSGSLDAAAQHVDAGLVSVDGSIPTDGATAVDAALHKSVAAAALGEQAAPKGPAKVKRRTPFYASVWFWLGVLAVGTGGVLIGATVKAPPPTGNLTVDGKLFRGQ